MKIRTGFVSNSSSSSFVCNTKLPLNKVVEKMELILEMYKKLLDVKPDAPDALDLKFENVFQDPRIGTEADNQLYREYNALERLYPDNTSVGKVIINSTSDNTIPYPLFELIEDIFEGT